ncbi:MAG: hypothetical protein IT290_12285 [Deltaproteobacteria bacterium]|nr:hypothetical protein [Deltaproteobacteria bacterium]
MRLEKCAYGTRGGADAECFRFEDGEFVHFYASMRQTCTGEATMWGAPGDGCSELIYVIKKNSAALT